MNLYRLVRELSEVARDKGFTLSITLETVPYKYTYTGIKGKDIEEVASKEEWNIRLGNLKYPIGSGARPMEEDLENALLYFLRELGK